jgi:hypothetical protein
MAVVMRAPQMREAVDEITALAPPQPGVFATSAYAQLHAWIAAYPEYEMREFERTGFRPDDFRQLRGNLEGAVRRARRLLKGDLAERPPRRMPSLLKIAQFHGLGDEPFCVRCGWQPPVQTWREASKYLERAHIIDRVYDGLDAVQNIAPLCGPCHRYQQPIFRDPLTALDWFGLNGHPARWHGITAEDYTWQDDIPYLQA